MVKRYCHKCNTEFDRKSHYDYHINRKYDCVLNNDFPIDLNDEKSDNLKLCDFVQDSCRNVQNENFFYNKQNKSNISNISNLDLVVLTDQTILTNQNQTILTNPNQTILTNPNQTILTNPNQTILKNPNNILDNTNKFSFCCSYCDKYYSSKSTLTRHLKDNCKIKKDSDNQKENIFKLLLEKDKQKEIEINELKKQNKLFEKQNKILMDKIDKLMSMKEHSNSSKTINNNLVTNNNLSTTINNDNSIKQNNQIIMVNFGKENLNIIDKQLFIDRVVKKNINGVLIPDEVLKIIHFNPMYPQLSNIYISDINRDKCMIYDNREWKLSNIDNIPLIMDKICLFSNEQIEILKNRYPNNKLLQDRLKTIGKYNNMIDNDYLDELKDNIEENKDEIKRCEDFQKKTQNTFKKTLYNEGKKIKKTIKQI
jgi:hypothetical protein